MGAQVYFDSYSHVGDVTVAAMCGVIFCLLFTSYVNKTKTYWIFFNIVIYLMLAALCNITCHQIYTTTSDGSYAPVYILRLVFHAFLFSILLLYVVYITTMFKLEPNKKRCVMLLASAVYIASITADIVMTVRGTNFRTDSGGHLISIIDVFVYGDSAFLIIILFLIIVFRKRLFNRVVYGFYGTIFISVLIMVIQVHIGNTSYSSVSFMLPTVAMLYVLHSTPYNAEIGAINSKAMEDMVRYNHRLKQKLVYMSLYLPDYDKGNVDFPQELQRVIRRFTETFFKRAVLFQVTNGHIILMARRSQNPDYTATYRKIMDAFEVEYRKFRLDYKIVAGITSDEISENNEYAGFIEYIHRHMNMNEVHIVNDGDVADYRRNQDVLSELEDIFRKQDLQDPRVLVYCQPVYNVRSGRYDTAEALMRLELSGIGMIYPDQFIYLAEEYGYIHVLTKIILSKVCNEIRRLIETGYEVKRISVNVSAVELHEEDFTDSITAIIRESRVPEDKVAIEVTETRTEDDFVLVKRKIEELRKHGIAFYLDDFGTGYSNMERILELPFDIIKFDRSLVTASRLNARSGMMVSSMAGMFRDLNYSVLYEGIENADDESRCVCMAASYLQGFRYSRPVPIAELYRFLSKRPEQ